MSHISLLFVGLAKKSFLIVSTLLSCCEHATRRNKEAHVLFTCVSFILNYLLTSVGVQKWPWASQCVCSLPRPSMPTVWQPICIFLAALSKPSPGAPLSVPPLCLPLSPSLSCFHARRQASSVSILLYVTCARLPSRSPHAHELAYTYTHTRVMCDV